MQQSLFNAVQTQLDEAWAAVQAKREWDAEIREYQQVTLDVMHQLKAEAVNALEFSNSKAANIIEDLATRLQSSQDSSRLLSQHLKEVYLKMTSRNFP